jgi:hypothetical protein
VADATNEQAVSSDVQVLARSTAGNDDGRKPGLDQPTGDPLKETWAIVGMVLCGLVLALVMGFALYSEHTLYESLLVQARDATRACPGVYLAYTASMAPYRSFTFFRAATVFLSFSLILLGAAFSFARIRAGGRAKVTGGEGLSLEVSSQYTGVVMIVLGAALAALGLHRSASPHVDNLSCENNPVWSRAKDGEEKTLLESYRINPRPPAVSAPSAGTSAVTSASDVRLDQPRVETPPLPDRTSTPLTQPSASGTAR